MFVSSASRRDTMFTSVRWPSAMAPSCSMIVHSTCCCCCCFCESSVTRDALSGGAFAAKGMAVGPIGAAVMATAALTEGNFRCADALSAELTAARRVDKVAAAEAVSIGVC